MPLFVLVPPRTLIQANGSLMRNIRTNSQVNLFNQLKKESKSAPHILLRRARHTSGYSQHVAARPYFRFDRFIAVFPSGLVAARRQSSSSFECESDLRRLRHPAGVLRVPEGGATAGELDTESGGGRGSSGDRGEDQ